jgi:hypothetical protein
MADSVAFDCVCEHLEAHTSLDRLEARGTVRLTLKQAGLDARDVTPGQLEVAVEKLLPGELSARGVEDTSSVCSAISAKLRTLGPEAGASDSPEDVFRRLGGG